MGPKNMAIACAVAAAVLWLVSYLASTQACFQQGCGNGNWFALVSVLTLFGATGVTVAAFVVSVMIGWERD